MKTLKTFIILASLVSLTFANAQTDPKQKPEATNNFLDLQARTLGNILGDSLTGGNGMVTDYLDLVNKSDMPEADKQNLRDAYHRYSQALDAQGKDSLSIALTQKFISKNNKDSIK
ncbi:hypothetical protein MWU78_20255 [Arenibacter sp. F26102]|uniref:hypothetical protein n=1 Tax=Arenibacter sp. F26102 TaxID=2926416 RepID=UPI001FF1042E|nr:hypothetical protein [Arenibacter sp. F26102]MCK0147990.1 hypothetical protein [Arenibacter sp. F26102]